MRIDFERSGGFTGIPLRHSINTEELPAGEQEKLAELIQAARFFDLPAVIRSTGPGADRFQYKISLDADEGKHTVEIDEAAVPSQLQPLIAWIQAARKR